MGTKLAEETRDDGRGTSKSYSSLVPRPSSLVAYRAVAGLLTALPVGPRQLRDSLAGRRHAAERWATWTGGRTIWFHAASVGEALSAEPVMRRLRAARPGLPLVLTYTSPSLARWPNPFPVARMDYAPTENAAAMRRTFAALRPALLVFSRSDLWPEMLLAAHRERVAVAVVGGTVSPTSLRLAWPARSFLRPLYRPIRFVGAVSEDDAGRWRRLGVSRDASLVTGDPRHDQVLERTVRLGALKAIAQWIGGAPTLVAGSIESGDAGPLLEAFRQVRGARPDARLVVVPHDPASGGAERFREVPGVLIVDSLGQLADLYLLADMVYVGGAHSTAEPAALAVPTIARGNLARQWLAWLEAPAAARRAGLADRQALQSGPSRATVDRLLDLLP